MTEPDWDPKPSERVYYRDARSGDLGWMVRRQGQDMILLDRPNQELLRLYRPTDFVKDVSKRDLSALQMARVAFEADKWLRYFQGEPMALKDDWLDLREDDRIRFTNEGPVSAKRAKLYRAVLKALEV